MMYILIIIFLTGPLANQPQQLKIGDVEKYASLEACMAVAGDSLPKIADVLREARMLYSFRLRCIELIEDKSDEV